MSHASYPLRQSPPGPAEDRREPEWPSPSPAEGRPQLARKRKAAKRGGRPGRGPQAPGQAGGYVEWQMEKVEAEPEGLQDLHLLDGLLARAAGRTMCTWEAAGRWMQRRPEARRVVEQ